MIQLFTGLHDLLTLHSKPYLNAIMVVVPRAFFHSIRKQLQPGGKPLKMGLLLLMTMVAFRQLKHLKEKQRSCFLVMVITLVHCNKGPSTAF